MQASEAQLVSSLLYVGVFPYLSSEQLLSFSDTIHESHKFGRTFNCNHEQRNSLWKAGEI